eukprot:4884633-Lingulodinium_polyedra.AAC.1
MAIARCAARFCNRGLATSQNPFVATWAIAYPTKPNCVARTQRPSPRPCHTQRTNWQKKVEAARDLGATWGALLGATRGQSWGHSKV